MLHAAFPTHALWTRPWALGALHVGGCPNDAKMTEVKTPPVHVNGHDGVLWEVSPRNKRLHGMDSDRQILFAEWWRWRYHYDYGGVSCHRRPDRHCHQCTTHHAHNDDETDGAEVHDTHDFLK